MAQAGREREREKTYLQNNIKAKLEQLKLTGPIYQHAISTFNTCS
jgi:hypothetical protein